MDPNNQPQPEPQQQPQPQPQPMTPLPTPNPLPPTMDMKEAELQKVDNPLSVMQPGERVICHIRRHPFGLIGMYFMAAVLLVVVLAGAALAPHFITGLSSQNKMNIFVGALFVTVITLIYLYVAATIYNGNRWIVTSDSITQVTQTGLFKKQSSQLSLGNLEDVTFEQESMLQSLFGFGTLHVETAGNKSKFVFPFCPTPQKCATEIIQAHEQYIAANPEGGARNNNQTFPPSPGLNTNV